MFPFGLLALAGAAAFLPETKRDPGRRLDWFGFLSLSLGVGSLQMMLDRGGQLDWFESWEIISEACLAVLGFYMFNVHCLTAKQPFLDPRLLAQRQFLPWPGVRVHIRIRNHAADGADAFLPGPRARLSDRHHRPAAGAARHRSVYCDGHRRTHHRAHRSAHG